VVCLILSISTARTEVLDFTVRQSGTISFLSTGEEMNFAAIEHGGISMSNHPNMNLGTTISTPWVQHEDHSQSQSGTDISNDWILMATLLSQMWQAF